MTWTTTVQYVDLETGEEISKQRAEKEYTIINKHRKVTFNEKNTKGTIGIVYRCRQKPRQLNAFGHIGA